MASAWASVVGGWRSWGRSLYQGSDVLSQANEADPAVFLELYCLELEQSERRYEQAVAEYAAPEEPSIEMYLLPVEGLTLDDLPLEFSLDPFGEPEGVDVRLG